MNLEVDRKIQLNHQSARLTKYGEDVRAVGWSSVESQETRARVISEIGDLSNKSILDVGCGFGDLYTFLKRLGIYPGKYVGIDINPKIIEVAKRRLPKVKFEVGDVMDSLLQDKFDFVVASGIFGLKTPNWQYVVEKQLSKMYDLCEIGVVVNFLSYYTTGKKFADSHYANPADILEFVFRNLSNRVVLRHDYRPNDFTVYVYRDKARK